MIRGTNYKIAFAHLTSRVKQAIIAILSVTFGISMYVFMNSFMTGVNDTQTDLAFSTLAHVRIYNGVPEDHSDLISDKNDNQTLVNVRSSKVIQYTEGIKNSEAIINTLKDYPEIEAVTSQLNINVFFRNGAVKLNGQLSGVDVDNENKLFKTSTYIKEGSWDALNQRKDGIIMGVGIAEKLSVKLNDNILVMTADGKNRNFKIVGIVEFTIAGVDNRKAFVQLGAAGQLESANMGYVSDIQINIKNYKDSRLLAEKLRKAVPYTVETWQESSGQLEAASKLRDIIAIAVSLAILIVAGFGIYNIMNMTVNEKIKEIAILKAMGFGGKDVVEIFLLQSVIIGILGGILGMLLGYAFSSIVDGLTFKIATLDTYPITYRPKDYILSFIFGFIATFIAGYLPAKKASKVDPVEIIRA